MSDESNDSLLSKLLKVDLDSLPTNEKEDLIQVLEDLTAPNPDNYKPHDKQKEFHKATNKYRVVLGGNRSGKTEMGGLEDIYHARGCYPDWYPQEGRFKTATTGRIIVTDFKAGAKTVENKLLKYINPSWIVGSPKRTISGGIERINIRHVSGDVSSIEILTHEQADMAFEGWNGHWAHFDEPPPRNKFIATIRGLIDLKGRCWLTMTPIEEPWIYDEFIQNDTNESVFVVTVDIEDNPYLPRTEIDDFIKRLTEDEKEARLHGKFRHLVGRVYKEFDPAYHCLSESKIKLNPGCPVYFVLDPADRRPHCGLWARVDPFGTVFVIDEICFAGTVRELSREILKREALNKIISKDVQRILDPNKGNTPDLATGLKLKDLFWADGGLTFQATVNDDVTTGHMAVAEKLHFDKKAPISFSNKPKLYFIKEHTQKCVKQLQSYIWDDHKDSAKDKKQKPKDINKDFPDCVRYLVMSNPMFYQVESEKDPAYGDSAEEEPERPTRFTKF